MLNILDKIIPQSILTTKVGLLCGQRSQALLTVRAADAGTFAADIIFLYYYYLARNLAVIAQPPCISNTSEGDLRNWQRFTFKLAKFLTMLPLIYQPEKVWRLFFAIIVFDNAVTCVFLGCAGIVFPLHSWRTESFSRVHD